MNITAIVVTIIAIVIVVVALWSLICDRILRPIVDWILWDVWEAIAMRWQLLTRVFRR